ncbi:MAG: hypothetical protein MUC60_02790 [Oscillatoria sp. Prado101]|jgi:hypothetical protein|nr:hypothetical protein [Oscillatoria sp. Prado101]
MIEGSPASLSYNMGAFGRAQCGKPIAQKVGIAVKINLRRVDSTDPQPEGPEGSQA